MNLIERITYDKPMRRILLLVNPLFEKKNSRDLPRIIHTLQQGGTQVEVQETTPNRGAGAQARLAVQAGIDLIVVCGGDGTVFDVIQGMAIQGTAVQGMAIKGMADQGLADQGMAGSAVPLGIIPFGTGNVLAQNLKIPKDPIAAARWILAAQPRAIPLGRLTYCRDGRQQEWFFAMTAGMGVHAAMMSAAVRAKKNASGRSAYFLAGIDLLFHHPLEPFDLEITKTSGEIVERRVCEAIAVRVAELNIWRPGGGFDLPFLRLASVETEADRPGSRWKLGRATYEGLFRAAGARNRKQQSNAPARYEDIQRVLFRPIPGFDYKVPLAIQADGEVLDADCATIEMAGVNLQMLSAAQHL